MEGKSGFQRAFLILNNEDAGYDTGQKPSGHVRLEVRDGHGKLRAAVQNLNTKDGKVIFRLYLIRTEKGIPAAVCAGDLKAIQNRCELEWGFDPENVHKSGLSINDFEVAAVLAEYQDRENSRLICPLAAYRAKKTKWRDPVEGLLYKQRSTEKKMFEESLTSKYPGTFESKYTARFEDKFPEEAALEPEYDGGCEEEEAPLGLEAADQTIPQTENTPPAPEIPVYSQEEPAVPDSKCLYMNGNMCGMYLNTAGANPCSTCSIHAQTRAKRSEEAFEKSTDLSKLKGQLDANFQLGDPFHSKRSDYKWWKVTNPVNLNNILYQCNIRSPLLFNPMVMMAHFKYRHLIIGIFSDKVRRHEYVVCGVPGMHMVDKKPFGELCKWVQADAGRAKYGAFGYWVVYIDPGSGKILSLK